MARTKLDASAFVNPGDEMHFMCPVCHEVSLEPRVLPCQHWLCQQCIITITDKRCHTCRVPYVGGGAVHRTLRAWLDATLVKCSVGDCKWEGQYGQLAEHGRSCKSTQLVSENAMLKSSNALLRKHNEDQQRKINYQTKELAEARTRKHQLEEERRRYSDNLLEKLLKKDRSRSPRKIKKDKKEQKEKVERAAVNASPSAEAATSLPVAAIDVN